MSENISAPRIHKSFHSLLFAAVLFTFLLVTFGVLVRIGDAAHACPDWPTCYGSFALPAGDEARLQVIHRALAAVSTLLTGLAAVWAARSTMRKKTAALAVYAAALIMLANVLLGGYAAIRNLSGGVLVGVFHQILALLSLGLLTVAALGSSLPEASAPGLRTPFSRLAAVTTGALFFLFVSGSFVSALHAGAACPTWPLCPAETPLARLALIHRMLTLIAMSLQTLLFLRAWRSERHHPVELTAATAAFILLSGQVFLGALMTSRNFPPDLNALHAVASAAFWVAQVLVMASAAFRSPAEEWVPLARQMPFKDRLKDFIALNKPIIVLLLLVTTYAGMVVGGKALPSLSLTFWTLLGGALAAGGSSALNQYIDRETDRAMQRTSRRPLPSGRMMPAEALAYGTGAVLTSFFLLAGFVNLLSALLSLAGMIYYVLIYSIWLKYTTTQNIVIGGGAGAIPPLVGWAAATGGLNIPSLFLFAIIFLWTPPHFWALALVRRNDYARGGVPMLPVVRGEKATRRQVFLYTLELVALTLLIPLFRLAGSVYLIAALLLGAWLVLSAWRVLRQGGNKNAWMMYRVSSMYLAFLFLAMVIDVLI
jgi:protoheme IX farnesyltransferase